MRNLIPFNTLLSALLAAFGLLSQGVFAHTGIAVLDAEGNDPHATDMADVTCFDDGNGPTAALFARIRDRSEPVAGLLLNLQVIRGNSATNTTDTVSGDGEFSEAVLLPGGDGVFRLLVNKTGFGARSFEVEWHCFTGTNVHTGTEITVRQVQ